MEITNARPEWNSENTAVFRAFLETPTGRSFLPALIEKIPSLLAQGDINSILIRSGEVRGFQAAAREILELAYPVPEAKPSSEAYPPLTDDSKWDDGEKLNNKE